MNAKVIGVGSTKFREHWGHGIKDLVNVACKNALASANLKLNDVDSLFVANCFGGLVNGQGNINSLCSDMLGIENSFSIGGGDSSGAYSIVQAANAITSGNCKVALVMGVEKMSDLGLSEVTELVSQVIDYESEAVIGATLASLYAMITMKHMELYGTTDQQLAAVSVKNHSNATENEIAQFRYKVTQEQVMKSPLVSDPIRVLNSAAPSDGCCALVMCSDEIAKKHKRKIDLIGSGMGADSMAVQNREDITTFKSIKSASKKALLKAGLKIEDISFAEVHDSFSIGEIISIEDLGLAQKGDGGKFIEDGSADLKGKFPINPSGGLKACGHPFAATGIRQAIESFYQLTNSSGIRQVKKAKYALTESLSGTGSTAVVNIFSKCP
jgi:acetyl-CoA C-acetyltransferase